MIFMFESNKRQNGHIDQAFFCGNFHDLGKICSQSKLKYLSQNNLDF